MLRSISKRALRALSIYFSSWFFSLPFVLRLSLKYCEIVGITPHSLHRYMVDQYCKTNGRLQDKLFKRICYKRRDDLIPIILSELNDCIVNGILYRSEKFKGSFVESDLSALKLRYIEDGYVQLPFSVDNLFVDHFINYLSSSCTLDFTFRTHNQTLSNPGAFNDKPVETIIAQTDLTNIEQKIDDKNIAAWLKRLDNLFLIMSQYLMDSKQAIKKDVSAWWTFPSPFASSECAQLYHFDCDSLKWVKFFIYLSDVDNLNGPHMSIKRTHIPGSKSQKLLNKGYVRHSDNDISRTLSPGQQEVEYSLKRGSIFAADTRCWHKGTPVQKQHRIILELVYLSHQLSREIG